ncbi:MAG TPA: hypothetical protein VJY65_09950 [Chloroflexota bacterium]|nr:hypothetical protein [Chloroflexota bacterium]
MAGEPQPPHVGNALAVEDEQVGLRLQQRDGGQHAGRFTKREQAGDVGERRGRARHLPLDDRELRPGEHDPARTGRRRGRHVAVVDAGDEVERSDVVFHHDAPAQLLLQGLRLRG